MNSLSTHDNMQEMKDIKSPHPVLDKYAEEHLSSANLMQSVTSFPYLLH